MTLRTAYVSFASLATPPLSVAGKLVLPLDEERPAVKSMAAVLICHGSDGVDGRGEFYAPALHEAGIATLEIDMWAARGTGRGAASRPGSPIETLPDAFGALRFLAAQPEIDPARIGIRGFSWGGVVSLLSAIARHADPLKGAAPGFSAHAANYPVCWLDGRSPAMALSGLTGAPVLIQTGDADTYDDLDAGEKLLASLAPNDARHVRQRTHKGAGHGFDRDLPAKTINDPAAHNGASGEVVMAFHPDAAIAARTEIVAFFEAALQPA
jgi:dienelactone hydrolase